jgi:small subunit ribosomal protein S17
MSQTFKGEVTKLGSVKTATVRVFRTKLHPKYHKPIRKGKNYQVHNEEHDLKIGDRVAFKSCRPLSKTKRFIVIEKIS